MKRTWAPLHKSEFLTILMIGSEFTCLFIYYLGKCQCFRTCVCLVGFLSNITYRSFVLNLNQRHTHVDSYVRWFARQRAHISTKIILFLYMKTNLLIASIFSPSLHPRQMIYVRHPTKMKTTAAYWNQRGWWDTMTSGYLTPFCSRRSLERGCYRLRRRHCWRHWNRHPGKWKHCTVDCPLI